MFLKKRNITSKIKRSKVTDYAALMKGGGGGGGGTLIFSYINRLRSFLGVKKFESHFFGFF